MSYSSPSKRLKSAESSVHSISNAPTTTSSSRLQAAIKAFLEAQLNAPRNLGWPAYRPGKDLLLLNDLPIYCLEMILANIPMQLLLSRYRAVCTKWCEEIEAMCRRQKRSLMICESADFSQILATLFGECNFADIQSHNIVCVTIPQSVMPPSNMFIMVREDFCHFLLHLFPHLTCLGIYFRIVCSHVYSKLITQLLSHWTPYLTSLTLIVKSQTWAGFDRFLYDRLFADFINACHKLERFHLFPEGPFYANLETLKPTLKRIEQFSLYDRYPCYLMPILTKHLGPKCARFWNYSIIDRRILEALYRSNPQIMANLTHLRIILTQDGMPGFIAQNFVSLRVLVLNVYPPSLESGFRNFAGILYNLNLLSRLSPLAHLTELHLNIWFEKYIPPIQPNPIPLLSLRKLRLQKLFHGNSTRQFDDFFMTLAAYVPNLEMFAIDQAPDILTNRFFHQFRPLFPKMCKAEFSTGFNPISAF